MGVYDTVRAAIMTPTRGGNGINVKLEGPVGIGKTAIISEVAESVNAHLEILTLSLMESVEANGHPFLDEVVQVGADGKPHKRRQMSYATPAWALRAAQAERAVIYLDELNMAAPSTFAAFMRVVNERHCGSFDLGPGVRFVAACNPTDVAQAAGGVDLPMALANRFCHLSAGLPEFGEWANWLSLGEGKDTAKVVDIEALEAKIEAEWADRYAAASGEVIGYLAARPSARLVIPNAGDPGASGAFPTPRSWEMFTRARASSVIHGLSGEDAHAFESGCIGKSHTAEFRTWLVDQDLPNAREWLAGSIEFANDARRLDRTQAFLIAAAIEWARMPKGKRQKELERIVGFYGSFSGRRDILVASAGLLSGGGVNEVKDEILALPLEHKKIVASIGALRLDAGKA